MPNSSPLKITTLTLADTINENNTPILTYNITYPYLSSPTTPENLWIINKYYSDNAHNFQTHINTGLKKDAQSDYTLSHTMGYPPHPYEALMTFTPTLSDPSLLSTYSDQYTYTGGAHGNTLRAAQTWNWNTGTQIPLTTFYPDLSIVKNQIRTQIQNQIASGDSFYFPNYKELVEQTFHPENYYLTPDGLYVFFQEYDIAPYAAGIVTFKMDSLNKESGLPDSQRTFLVI
jgi:hypothetical protein